MSMEKLKFLYLLSITYSIFSFPVHAQLIDTLGGIGIGGIQTVESIKNISSMQKSIQVNQILNDIQTKVYTIIFDHMGSYQNLQATQFSTTGITGHIIPINSQSFGIKLDNVPQLVCQKIINHPFQNIKEIQINNKKATSSVNCTENNQIFYIFN